MGQTYASCGVEPSYPGWPLWHRTQTRMFGHYWLETRQRRHTWNSYARACPDAVLFQESTPFTLYALLEPDTSEIRYIGITQNAQNRLSAHARDKSGITIKQEWLVACKARGKPAQMKHLATIWGPREVALQHEQAWIRVLFAEGCDLLNYEALMAPYVYAGQLYDWDVHTSKYLRQGIPTGREQDIEHCLNAHVARVKTREEAERSGSIILQKAGYWPGQVRAVLPSLYRRPADYPYILAGPAALLQTERRDEVWQPSIHINHAVKSL